MSLSDECGATAVAAAEDDNIMTVIKMMTLTMVELITISRSRRQAKMSFREYIGGGWH